MTKVNRFELIDHTDSGHGREFVKWLENNFEVRTELQDDGRTMKVFLKDIDSEPDDGDDLWPEQRIQKAVDQRRANENRDTRAAELLAQFPSADTRIAP